MDTVIHSTVDDPEIFARRITHLRSCLGAYTGAFRTGDTVYLSGRLVHTKDGPRSGFGIELTPWTAAEPTSRPSPDDLPPVQEARCDSRPPTALFASAAEHYARFRPGYPDEFFALLAERFGLDGTQTAMDLGCGPGMSALPLAPHVDRLYAIDPLASSERQCSPAGRASPSPSGDGHSSCRRPNGPGTAVCASADADDTDALGGDAGLGVADDDHVQAAEYRTW
ncbi:hypothetical protein [Streptomyces sp. NPDC056632]|uniref:hypothetical protein n=1 Tax=Streptomyces sp. NPDC056632 TaxID=3345884 RepID=UPI0036C618CC